MDFFTSLALCYSLASFPDQGNHKDQASCQKTISEYHQKLSNINFSKKDILAIQKITYSEAANQGDDGISAVTFVILNRLISGQFGKSITEIINAKNQFEPATKANGWENLPEPPKSHKIKIETILSLSVGGYFPDPTSGALYFQNPKIVRERESKGDVSQGLTNFGDQVAVVKIKDHAFYHENKTQKISKPLPKKKWDVFQNTDQWDVFSDQNKMKENLDVFN